MITEKTAVIRVFDDLAQRRSWEGLYSGRLNRTTYNFLSRFRGVQELVAPLIQPGTTLLDLGCGTGDLLPFCIRKGASYCGVDLSAKMIQRAEDLYGDEVKEGKARFLVDDCENLQFGDGEFDGVLAVGLLEYLPDPAACLQEIARVLKNGGFCLVTVPYKDCIDSKLRSALKPLALRLFPIYAKFHKLALVGMSDVKHYSYNEAELGSLLKKKGFRNVAERFTNFHVIPYPLNHLLPQLYMRLSERIDLGGRGSKNRHWASNYLALFQKT